jgi:hypothetical protein
MFNRVDKCFFITTFMLIFSIIFPVILIFTLIARDIKFFFEIIFVFTVINYIFIVPILYIILIITFIMKVIAKNKHKKDLSCTFCKGYCFVSRHKKQKNTN